MVQTLVSVIIPAYNRLHLIEPAIKSVLEQTYRKYEIIVVDDASTDGTSTWIAEHYPQIRLISLQKNSGAAEARNIGIKSARGEFIAFLDSDDYWDSHYLTAMTQVLEAYPGASFAFSNHREILRDGSLKQCVYKHSKKYSDLVHRSLADVFIYTMSAVVARKQALDDCGLLDSRLSSSHDRELYIRLMQVGEMLHVEDFLVTRVMHDQNISSDYQNWIDNVFMTLDVFFEKSENQHYLPLRATLISTWAMIFARYFWQVERAPFKSALMLLRAFVAAPNRMLQKLRDKLLLKNA